MAPTHARRFITCLLLSMALTACSEEERAAPSAEPATPPSPAPAAPEGSTAFAVETATSEVDFLMEAPLENIHGVAPGALSGTLNLDLSDLSRSTAEVRVDLDALVVRQRKRESPEHPLGEEEENPRQNAHMRMWLQISEDGPEAEREANRWAVLRIDRVSDVSQADVTGGVDGPVTLTAHGTLRLHGRETPAHVPLALRFGTEGERVRSVEVRTTAPLAVDLEAHDVRPRSAFARLAEKTLAMMGEKVAGAAPITASFTARAD